jgi:translocator protein
MQQLDCPTLLERKIKIKIIYEQSNFTKLILSITLPLVLGAIAGMFTSHSVPDWYSTLNRPSFNPPNWIFEPVWTILYILVGISFFVI